MKNLNRLTRVKNLIPEMERLFLEGNNITEIGKKLNIWYHTVGKHLKLKGYTYSDFNKKDINSDIFSVIDAPEKAYWLGMLYADGCITGNNKIELSLKSSDYTHLVKFKEFLSYKGNILYKEKVKAYRIMFSDTKIYNDLYKLGHIPKKSLILKFPTEEQVPNYLLSHFIRGYFDGDGYISDPTKKSISVNILGTENMLLNILNCLELENIKVIKKQNIYSISFSGDKARIFLNFIYKNENICLERKKIRYLKHKDKNDKYKTKRDSK